MIKRARDQGVNAVTLAFIDDLEDMIEFAEEKKDRRTRIKLGKIENELFLLSSDLDYKNYEKRVVEDLIRIDGETNTEEKEIREKIKEINREKDREIREEIKKKKRKIREETKKETKKEKKEEKNIFLIKEEDESTLEFCDIKEAANHFDVSVSKVYRIRNKIKAGGIGKDMGYWWFFE